MYSHLARTLVATAIITMFMATALAAAEPILIGKGVDAKWSPDGKFVSFLRNDSLVAKSIVPDGRETVLKAIGIYKYEWSDDSTLYVHHRYFGEEGWASTLRESIVRVSLDGQMMQVATDSFAIGAEPNKGLGLRKLPGGAIIFLADSLTSPYNSKGPLDRNSTILSQPTSRGTNLYCTSVPEPWGKVWLWYGGRDRGRQLTLSENYYLFPTLAPSEDKVFCKSQRGDLVVFDTLGIELANLGRVDMPVWDAQGQHIAFARLIYSEYDVEGGDLFVSRFDGSDQIRLTNSPKSAESEVIFSPDSRFILYRDGSNTNLYILEIK